ARRRNPLHHLYGVFRHLARGSVLASPVGVSELGHQVAALLERVQRERHVELATQCRLESDLDVVVIDEHRYVQFVLHSVYSPVSDQTVCLTELRMNSTISWRE